ncbi:ATP-dependent helicase [Bacillus paranthracis]|uniref:UvrD-helicase domain-containing protein n=1 Tax=Bacillus TaxID=1386 RepID=UPI00097678A3|nr:MULTISPECIES: ATP-dependent helicase [Bacillus cereus group]ONG66685.1 DNA helicase [Bacillus cereus]MDA2666757.1 ATP-dependent helicase [Bacillus cereus group sp. Bc032]MDA2677469.1 ATP-dependent helicase [Bacillus cereus group sp. Bc031]MDA2682965.1 ATP-dependent helicase [Bacillus cereus group sp. Bc029]MDA2688427.1 ATP-dependent helicase [Bacillus cereus group sp. Bc030]
MNNKVLEQDWKTSNDVTLEDSALLAIRASNHVAIAAGPGAGKTELLAHKAGYLIQTGICPNPKKILAISFKTDAARNLQERVELRYGKNVENRFESKTFDAFAKGILDQFIYALPKDYQPDRDYEIILNEKSLNDIIKGYITKSNPYHPNWQHEYHLKKVLETIKETELPIVVFENDLYSWINERLWMVLLNGKGNLKSSLTFSMITILAEYLLKENPLIVKALQATYSHVFLDEFQDTTYNQYSLLKTIFLNSDTVITAVGDNKQRIMGWAGALHNAFGIFKSDFNATQHTLFNNFRSAPKLVSIQNIFSKTLNDTSMEVLPVGEWNKNDGVCEIWNFKNHKTEAILLASYISEWMKAENLNPRDFCIIVKQQEHIYAAEIMKELSKINIKSRIEKDYQDLLSEELVLLIIRLLQLSYEEKSPELWLNIIDEIIDIKYRDVDPENIKYRIIENELVKTLDEVRKLYSDIDVTNFNSQFTEILQEIIVFLGEDSIKATYPKYKQANYFEEVIQKMLDKLKYQNRISMRELLQEFCGKDSIPIMTIHKSKGLEYHTVIFIGVEDAAFWSFSTQKEADKNAFFVALSRARQKMIFTISKKRNILKYGKEKNITQATENVSELIQTLMDAGVPLIEESDLENKL